MKKLLLLAAVIGINGLAHATIINAPSSLSTLEGNNAYSWGITIAVPTGQQVTGAEIDFTTVDLVASGNSQGTGMLYTDLLNSKSTGVNSPSDGDVSGDYWGTKYSGKNITALGAKFFAAVGTTLTWSYMLSSDELLSLNSYLTANGGIFNIGIDPDCKFTGTISFNYTTGSVTHNTVPDIATTALLLVLGLAGLEVFRRQFVAAKFKA